MRIHLLLFCAVLALSLPAQTNKQIRKLQSQQTELKKQLGESEKLLRSTKKDVKSQLNNLALLDGQIGEKERYITAMQHEVDTLDMNIRLLQNQLAGMQKELEECKRKYRRSVMYMYNNRMTENKLMFIFSAENFRQMYRRARYMLEYSRYQRAQGNIIKDKAEKVKAKQDELLANKSEKNRLLDEGRREQELLEGQKKERQGMVNRLNKKQKQLQAAIKKKRREADQLNAKIEKLIQKEVEAAERRRKAEEAKRRAAEKARREREAAKNKKGAAGGTAKKGSGKGTAKPVFTPESNADRKLSNNFTSNKGRLPVPITGAYVISGRYGQYNVEGMKGVRLDNKGIDLTGRYGAEARAVFDGEVSSVFQMGGYWNVIVRHGHYMSVYSRLSGVSVRQGQKVKTRQSLGRVLKDDSGNATLQFQLWHETTKLNPSLWIGR